jgi:hypothetical protein
VPSLDHLFTQLHIHVLLGDALRRRASPLRVGMGRVEVGKSQRFAVLARAEMEQLYLPLMHSECSGVSTGRTYRMPRQCMHVNLHTQLKRACVRVVRHIELYGGCADTA